MKNSHDVKNDDLESENRQSISINYAMKATAVMKNYDPFLEVNVNDNLPDSKCFD